MKATFYIPVVAVLILGCDDNRPDNITFDAASFVVHLDSLLVLGADESSSPENLFGRPVSVTSDSRSRIYVADAAAMTVRVFDQAGTYKHSIGSRGEAPGEFIDITCMFIDDLDRLVVVDSRNQRLTRFAPNGMVVSTHPLRVDLLHFPRQGRSYGRSKYLFVYRPSRFSYIPHSQHYLLHLIDERVDQHIASFMPISILDNPEDLFQYNKLEFSPGSFDVTDKGDVIYAPPFYTGELFKFSNVDSSWSRSGTLHGRMWAENAFTRVSRRPFPPEAAVINSDDSYAAIVNSQSLGIFVLQNGFIVHFTFNRIGGVHQVGVEIFDTDERLRGYMILDDISFKGSTWRASPVSFLWKDTEDRFYMIDRRGIPMVRIFHLRLEPLSANNNSGQHQLLSTLFH